MGLVRLLLALAVVAAHSGPAAETFVPFFRGEGVTPVTIFFMISGFYMALVNDEKYKGRIGDFYRHRLLRIFPIYWMLLLLFLAISAAYSLLFKPIGIFFVLSHNEFSFAEGVWAFFANVTTLGSDATLLYDHEFDRQVHDLIALSVVWSLSCEIIFYALCPVFINRLRMMAILFVAFCALRIGVAGAANWRWTPWNYFFFPTIFPLFLIGAISYRLSNKLPPLKLSLATSVPSQVALYSILPIGIAFWGAFDFFANREVLQIASFLLLPLVFEVSKNWTFDRWLGEFSYPLYLSHFGIASIWAPFRHFIPDSFKFLALVVGALALSYLAVQADGILRRAFTRTFPILRDKRGPKATSSLPRATSS